MLLVLVATGGRLGVVLVQMAETLLLMPGHIRLAAAALALQVQLLQRVVPVVLEHFRAALALPEERELLPETYLAAAPAALVAH